MKHNVLIVVESIEYMIVFPVIIVLPVTLPPKNKNSYKKCP